MKNKAQNKIIKTLAVIAIFSLLQQSAYAMGPMSWMTMPMKMMGMDGGQKGGQNRGRGKRDRQENPEAKMRVLLSARMKYLLAQGHTPDDIIVDSKRFLYHQRVPYHAAMRIIENAKTMNAGMTEREDLTKRWDYRRHKTMLIEVSNKSDVTLKSAPIIDIKNANAQNLEIVNVLISLDQEFAPSFTVKCEAINIKKWNNSVHDEEGNDEWTFCLWGLMDRIANVSATATSRARRKIRINLLHVAIGPVSGAHENLEVKSNSKRIMVKDFKKIFRAQFLQAQ
ncbi:MAG: hypothetical protein ISR65_08280 [Bacteriovoracaceae bacterium]|nr:hypothetical protein [Bacteriovoracaceae bacterium]